MLNHSTQQYLHSSYQIHIIIGLCGYTFLVSLTNQRWSRCALTDIRGGCRRIKPSSRSHSREEHRHTSKLTCCNTYLNNSFTVNDPFSLLWVGKITADIKKFPIIARTPVARRLHSVDFYNSAVYRPTFFNNQH